MTDCVIKGGCRWMEKEVRRWIDRDWEWENNGNRVKKWSDWGSEE